MSLQSHLAELEKKHQALERALHEAKTSPSASPDELADIKRKKLQLKDEISRLRQDGSGRSLH